MKIGYIELKPCCYITIPHKQKVSGVLTDSNLTNVFPNRHAWDTHGRMTHNKGTATMTHLACIEKTTHYKRTATTTHTHMHRNEEAQHGRNDTTHNHRKTQHTSMPTTGADTTKDVTKIRGRRQRDTHPRTHARDGGRGGPKKWKERRRSATWQ